VPDADFRGLRGAAFSCQLNNRSHLLISQSGIFFEVSSYFTSTCARKLYDLKDQEDAEKCQAIFHRWGSA